MPFVRSRNIYCSISASRWGRPYVHGPEDGNKEMRSLNIIDEVGDWSFYYLWGRADADTRSGSALF